MAAIHDCNNRMPFVLTPGSFHHFPANDEDKDPIKNVLGRNQVKQTVTPEAGGIVFNEPTQQKVANKPARLISQTQKRSTSSSNEKQQSSPQQTASALKDNHECQDEFNRMRERLFRMLSKVPIQVETQQVQQVQDLTSTCCQETPSFASSSSSNNSGSVTCSTSTSSSVGSSYHSYHQPLQQQQQQQQHKPVIDREPLIIKYYHERSLEEILELHFGCSLIKLHQIEFGSQQRFRANDQLGNQQNYGPQTVNHQEVLASAQTPQNQPHYLQQPAQFGLEAQYQCWQPPDAFANNTTRADYSWHPYDTAGGFPCNNKTPSITPNGIDKCNRGNSGQQSSKRAKDNIATNGRLVGCGGGRQVAKRVRSKRSLNSCLPSHSQAQSNSLLQPNSNRTMDVEERQPQHQHLSSPVAAIFSTVADTFHQPPPSAPSQYTGAGHHHHLYAYQPSADTSASSESGMLSFNQVAQGEPAFVGQGELASTTCGHHYNDDLHLHQQHQSHQHQQQASSNYYQPTAGLIYQQAQVQSANLYTSPVPLESSAVNEHQHHFQHHQQQHHHHNQHQLHPQHQHQHQHHHLHQQQPMIEQQPDYVASTEPHQHRIAFYPQTGSNEINGAAASYVFTPQSAPAQEASLSYSGQQPGSQLEMVGNRQMGPAPG